MKKCKLAVIGFGQRGYTYVRMIKDTPAAELVAVCDIDPSRASEFAKELGVASVPCYTSVDELLAKADFDAVVITTPDFEHCKGAIACCKAGKSIAARIAMIAITTRSSIRVKLLRFTRRTVEKQVFFITIRSFVWVKSLSFFFKKKHSFNPFLCQL